MANKKTRNKERGIHTKTDGYENVIAGIRAGRAKSQGVQISSNNSLKRQWTLLDELYENSWLDAKIIDKVPDEMTREWLDVKSDNLTPEQLTEVEKLAFDLCIQEKTNEALKWSRLYGGCTLVLVVKDGKEAVEPLDLDNIGELIAINVVDNRYIHPAQLDYNPLSPTYGEPITYRFASHTNNEEVHYSRIIKFEGKKLPYYKRKENNYWGASVLTSVQDAVKDVYMVLGAVAELVYEAKFDVLKVPDLSSMLLSKNGEEVLTMMMNINEQKSVTNTVAIDSEMDMITNTYSFAGLRDVVQESFVTISTATDIPEMILTSRGNGGLNASNKEVLQVWHDTVAKEQRYKLLKPEIYLYQVLASSLGYDYKGIEIEFRPLSERDESDKANTDLVIANTRNTYLSMGVVTEEEVREQVKEDDIFTNLEENPTDLFTDDNDLTGGTDGETA